MGGLMGQGCGESDRGDRPMKADSTDPINLEKVVDTSVKEPVYLPFPDSMNLPGRLVVHPINPAYFQDVSTGKAIFLHGYDHFRSLQEFDNNGISPIDFEAFIAKLRHYRHNFLRLWVWEHFWRRSSGSKGREKGQVNVTLPPHVYQRTGPGIAIDGQPKFDLQAFEQAYFDRIRQRVITAGESGIWVSVMLFQGWSIYGSGKYANSPWEGHPLNIQNNINGIDGDYDKDGRGWEIHTRVNPLVNAIHDAYVKKVIDTVGDLDHVLFEVSNESIATGIEGVPHHITHVRDWAYHVIELVRNYERQRGYGPHPIGLSSFRPLPHSPMSVDWNSYLFLSSADYVSPNGTPWTGDVRWKKNPSAAKGNKVIIADTDHIHPDMHGGPGMRSWQWRTFTRGHSINAVDGDPEQGSDWVTPDDSATMQVMARYVDMVDLGEMRPHDHLSTTRYCLANPGHAYIVYQPTAGFEGGSHGFPFELQVEAGWYQFEWFNPEFNQIIQKGTMQAESGISTFTPPFSDHAVLFLWKEDSEEKRS